MLLLGLDATGYMFNRAQPLWLRGLLLFHVLLPVLLLWLLYRLSIDAVLMNVARRYGKRSGAIIFSGMGNDGTEGVRAMAAQGAEVWAQDAASCLVSSMPDQVRQTGLVSFSGTPEALAQRLSQLHPAQPAAARRLYTPGHTPGQTGLTA